MISLRSAGFALAAVSLLIGFAASTAAAQTLTNPNAPQWSPPHAAAKPHEAIRSKKSCKQFGAGFVAVPGSDACVKIGGFVTVEGDQPALTLFVALLAGAQERTRTSTVLPAST